MHWIKAEKDEVGARETFGRERIWGTKWEQETAQPDFGIKWSSFMHSTNIVDSSQVAGTLDYWILNCCY